MTDSRGRFVFTNLPKGTYNLWAVKPGFISGRPGQRRPGGGSLPLVISDADRIGDVKVPVWKQASIAGTIVDDVGEPVVDLPVRVLIRSIVAGRPKLTPNLTVRTDDRGAYRMGGLAPGEYVVIVPSTQSTAPESIVDLYRQSRQAGNQLDPQTAETLRTLTAGGGPAALTMAQSAGTVRIGNLSFQSAAGTARSALPSSPSADGRMFVYPAQYYPNAATPAQATVISLQSGEERAGINLQLRLVPTRARRLLPAGCL